ncbi:MAG: zf-HC2 domain-containing protein [Candidatus Eremiobacteraeota bacterium]|nr:zf-HC2 domain-containing protein [Candidatus Eremiobacteraeota bacterium]
MNHQHATADQLVDYIHGELPPGEDAWVHAHLRECASCERAYDAEASLTAQLRELAATQERELPDDYARRVLRAAQRPERWGGWAALSAFARPLIAVPAAACVAALLYFGVADRWGAGKLHAVNALSYVHHHTAVTAAGPFSDDTPVPAVLTAEATAKDSADASP